jgi:hypothetical protein
MDELIFETVDQDTGLDRRLTTITSAARMLGIPVSSAYYHIDNEDLTLHRYGSKLYVDWDEAQRVLAARHRHQKHPYQRKKNTARKSILSFVSR